MKFSALTMIDMVTSLVEVVRIDSNSPNTKPAYTEPSFASDPCTNYVGCALRLPAHGGSIQQWRHTSTARKNPINSRTGSPSMKLASTLKPPPVNFINEPANAVSMITSPHHLTSHPHSSDFVPHCGTLLAHPSLTARFTYEPGKVISFGTCARR
jgi:hypothetical protein